MNNPKSLSLFHSNISGFQTSAAQPHGSFITTKFYNMTYIETVTS